MHSEPHQLRILIADRPGPARSALAGMLTAVDDVVVVGAEGSAAGLRAALRTRRPDVLVIDDRLLGDWHEPYELNLNVIVVGVDDDPLYAKRANQRHAAAWVPKECAGEQLVGVLDGIRDSLTRRTPPAPPALHGERGSAR